MPQCDFNKVALHLIFNKTILKISTNTPSILQQFFISLYLHTTIPVIYTKNIFPASDIQPIQAVSQDKGATESCEERHCFNLSLLSESMGSDKGFTITDSLLRRLNKLVYCRQQILMKIRMANDPFHLLSCLQPIVIISLHYQYHHKNSNSLFCLN